MANLIRKSRIQHNADLLLRKLLEKWHKDGQLAAQLEPIIEESAITLSEEEQERIKSKPVDYLLGIPAFVRHDPAEPPRATMKRYITHQLLSRGFDTRALEDLDTFRNTLFREALHVVLGEPGAALSDDEQQELFEDLCRDLYG